MTIDDIEKILRQKDFISEKDYLNSNLRGLKKLAVQDDDQEAAKYLWCLEQVLKVKSLFVEAFRLMKNGDFQSAWYNLDRSDIELGFLRWHIDYSDNKFDLLFIEREIPKYQELFPYDFFTSRESIESDFTCSICGAKMGIRNKCSHQVGEIYNGEMCCRQINKIDFLAISIVKKPFDKYTILQANGVEYNYYLLESLMQYLDDLFEEWGYDIEELNWDYTKDKDYRSIVMLPMSRTRISKNKLSPSRVCFY